MHGHVHNCLHNMIMKHYGDSTWKKLMYKSGSDLSHFMKLRTYDDEMTMRLFETAAQVVGISTDEFILSFGKFWLKYIMGMGYLKLLQSLGPTFYDFAENLDTVHSLLNIVYDDLVHPQFRCETFPDKTLLLHYYTTRPTIAWLIGGMMLAAAEAIYKVKLAYCLEKVGIFTEGTKPVSHTAMVIRVREDWATDHLQMDDLMEKFRSEIGITDVDNIPENLTNSFMVNGVAAESKETLPSLNPQILISTFPYHILIDTKLIVKQIGSKLRRLYPQVMIGTPFGDSCKIKYPKMPICFNVIRQFGRSCFIVEIPGRRSQKSLFLKGQMLPIDGNHIMFMCSPDVDTITELLEKKIFICDLPVFDTTREFMLLNQVRVAEGEKGNSGEEATASIQRLTAELHAEKSRSDTFLKETLPERIVEELRESNRVPAEKYDLCSVLLCELSNLDSHSRNLNPIDLVEILNNVTIIFEMIAKQFNVYKVDTRSESHMMVGGVPDPDQEHAKKIGQVALEMVTQAQAAIPPGKSQKDTPQIKIGIHCGSAVAGVVGEKIPRYCIFGSTVTVASQMVELCGPGRIQTSQEAQRYLAEVGFQLEERGTIKLKGKGKVTTFYLISAGTSGAGNPVTGSAIIAAEKSLKSTVSRLWYSLLVLCLQYTYADDPQRPRCPYNLCGGGGGPGPGPIGNSLTGATGATGYNGPTGATGVPGPRGYDGNPGTQGMRGFPGEKGPSGNDGRPGGAGPPGPPGNSNINGGGATGYPGPTGSTGVHGRPGNPGPQGATGFQGWTGEPGRPGLPGSNGATGYRGPSGPGGSTGSRGKTGATGSRGGLGPSGRDGNPGRMGATGFSGNPGPQGARGPSGPPGVSGLRGATGLPGPTGYPGAQGPPGAKGDAGVQGLPGPVGPAGPPGTGGGGGGGEPGGTCCLNECAIQNGGCEQYCIDTYESHFCACRPGYVLLNPPCYCETFLFCQYEHNNGKMCFCLNAETLRVETVNGTQCQYTGGNNG